MFGNRAYAVRPYASVDRSTVQTSASIASSISVSALGNPANIKAQLDLSVDISALGLRAELGASDVTIPVNIQALGRQNKGVSLNVSSNVFIGATGKSMIGRLIKGGADQAVYTVRIQPFRIT